MLGCMNPNADNYNPDATQPDGSCVFTILDHNGTPRSFSEETELVNKSFTMSYSLGASEKGSWVFYHDYIPDFYFQTRDKLWCLKNDVYQMDGGPYGEYFNAKQPHSFFIDVVFNTTKDSILESLSWVTEVLSGAESDFKQETEWSTLTHISIWNSQQHSGRIELKQVFQDLQYSTHRRTQGEWSFNDFRNQLLTRGNQFLQDLFHNYDLLPDVIGPKPWYDKELLEDKYFVVRFEYDNKENKQIILHQTNAEVLQSDR